MVENTICPRVQLFISCRKLKDIDIMSKSDPYVEILERRQEGQWISKGFTEVIENNLNPDFVKNFELPYMFEEHQYLKFRVYDSDDGTVSAKHQNFIGETECTIGEIVGSQGQQLIKTLKSGNNRGNAGCLVLRCEQVTENNDNIIMQLSAKGLEDTSGFFHSMKPFFYLSRAMESGGNQRVYKSEHSTGKDVIWKLFNKSMKDLCNGDPTRPIILEVYDYHSSGNHDLHSATDFSIYKITEQGVKEFPLVNSKKKSKKGYKGSGTLRVNSIQMDKNYTLLDYISGGLQISLVVAVDFTGSNGIPSSPQSLHYMNPSGMNQYEQALFAVSSILLNYDSDKQVPLYGFGGKIRGQTSHCFNMNFNPAEPNVNGIDGIMGAYRNSLRYVELSGPTLFGHVLGKVVTELEAQPVSQNYQQYTVLLILTDGEIHDMVDTVNWIVRGSVQPLSIVIVGIGNDSFRNMVELDADDKALMDSKGVKMQRDIVQFVPFRDVGNSPARLTKEVLEEIPREVCNFFKMRSIFPNPAIAAPEYDFYRSYTVAENPPPYQPNPNSAPPPQYAAASKPQTPQGYQSVPYGGPPQTGPGSNYAPGYGTVPPQGYQNSPLPQAPQNYPPQGFQSPPGPGVPKPPPQGYQTVPPQGYQNSPPPVPMPQPPPQGYQTVPPQGYQNPPPSVPFPQPSQNYPPQGFQGGPGPELPKPPPQGYTYSPPSP